MTVLVLLAALTSIPWRALQPGVELATVQELVIVRVDPSVAKLGVGLASEGPPPQTAAQWCRTANFSVAINLGMFQTDHRSNVGYLRHGKHFNNRRWNSYRSAVAIGPGVRWVDLDQQHAKADLDRYDIVVQNLRLIAGKGRNVWSRSDRRWSEAALAIDAKGRLLFLFSRAPWMMRDFNELVLKLPLEITQAMHLEGGPEASLSIHAGGVDLDLSGSYETSFLEDDSNHVQWPLPNVLGVRSVRPGTD